MNRIRSRRTLNEAVKKIGNGNHNIMDKDDEFGMMDGKKKERNLWRRCGSSDGF